MAEKAGLTLKEAMDLLNAQTSRGDAMWNFYMLVSVGVLTLGLEKAEDWHTKIVLSLAFLIFASVNAAVLYRTQEGATLLYDVIRTRADADNPEPELRIALTKLKRATPRRMLWFHLVLDIVVIAALWTR
ncbi:MAG TPA: hypothetical protein VFX96_07420 [Pyrinomonadaceae bacterium]|nr:hypothetical protein [Pyrinomonadaceae bacterium]